MSIEREISWLDISMDGAKSISQGRFVHKHGITVRKIPLSWVSEGTKGDSQKMSVNWFEDRNIE